MKNYQEPREEDEYQEDSHQWKDPAKLPLCNSLLLSRDGASQPFSQMKEVIYVLVTKAKASNFKHPFKKYNQQTEHPRKGSLKY